MGNSCGISKKKKIKMTYKVNEWIDKMRENDIWYNVNAGQDTTVSSRKLDVSMKMGFSPKKCNICQKMYDGYGKEEALLPSLFIRLPLKSKICWQCKKEKKSESK